GVVVLAVGDRRDAVEERDRPCEVFEREELCDLVPSERPSTQVFHAARNLVRGEQRGLRHDGHPIHVLPCHGPLPMGNSRSVRREGETWSQHSSATRRGSRSCSSSTSSERSSASVRRSRSRSSVLRSASKTRRKRRSLLWRSWRRSRRVSSFRSFSSSSSGRGSCSSSTRD